MGLDPEKLEAFGRLNLAVSSPSWPYKGVLVIKNGRIVGEWYNQPKAQTTRTYLSSNGKAFALMCFGIMAEDSRTGKISTRIGPQSHVYDRQWLPEGFPLSDSGKADITFEEIFEHTSGLCPEANEKGRNRWTDYVKWITGHDPKWPQTSRLYFQPGRPASYPRKETQGRHVYAYSSVGFGHLGLVFQNVYRMPAHEFLWQRLLEPIGFSGIGFEAPPSGQIKWFSAGGLRMTPRDYARFAYFLMHHGRWGNRQLVPADWVKRFTSSPNYPNIRSNVDGFFGKQYPRDMFMIGGSGLNWAFIVPSLDLIAIRTSRANNALWDSLMKQYVQSLFAAVIPSKY